MGQRMNPLAEVFGHVLTDNSPRARRDRENRLCPFGNNVPNCTKDKAKNPLGVCSILQDGNAIVTCPIRFREDWLIAADAASFFFPSGISWSSLTEVRLNEAHGKAAGNIDVVLVAYDSEGTVVDFGALEIQAVYISGNVRDPFEHFMADPNLNADMDWSTQPNYPRADFLSSSRKRLAPQLLYKGGILHSWQKKTAIALNKCFFDTLPPLPIVQKADADMVWLIYDLLPFEENGQKRYGLAKTNEVFTKFAPALASITTADPGNVDDFVKLLQEKLDDRLEAPPVNRTLERPF